MASLQDIRRRIKSVKSIQQITNAMNMVATSRLRSAKEAAVANKPYADKMAQVVSDVAANAGDFSHPLLEVRQEGSVCCWLSLLTRAWLVLIPATPSRRQSAR